MTTEQPSVQRRLYRRSDDRVLGGVAGGLGDYFNVDPLLIRIGFVGLMVFGGMGVFLYLVAWLLVPDDATGQSIGERLVGASGLRGGPITVLFLLLLALVFLSVLVNVAQSSGWVGWVGLAILVIVFGTILLRRNGGEPSVLTAAPEQTASTAEGESTAPEGGAAPTRPYVAVRRPPRRPSPLGWYVTGAALVAVGLLAVATNVTGAAVDLGQYFGLGLAVIGIGLVIGTWWGHARLLILLGLVLLPFAFAASLINVPLEGGWGSRTFSPTAADEVQDEYRLVGGQMVLDLTRVDPSDAPMAIAASVAMGEILVLLPDDAGGEIDTTVGGGRFRILGDARSGTRLQDNELIDGNGPQFALDLEAGLGVVRVETRQVEGR